MVMAHNLPQRPLPPQEAVNKAVKGRPIWAAKKSRFTATAFLLVLLPLTGCDDAASESVDQAQSQDATSQEMVNPSSSPPPNTPQPASPNQTPNSQEPPPGADSSPPKDDPSQQHMDYLEQQIAENEAKLRAERDRFDQERRQKAIAEYEAALSHYTSEIQRLTKAVEGMEKSRDAAYSDFQQEFGVPFVRFNTDCGNSTDFFRCINASAAMPTFEFSIQQAETDIGIYYRAIDALQNPY